MTIKAVHQGGMKITAYTGTYELLMDYPLKGEPPLGFKPLETLLASLAGCAGNTLALLMRKTQQPFSVLEVEVKAERRDEHPTIFTRIHMEFRVQGAALDEGKIQNILKDAEERVCPVWAMLKGSVPITSSLKLTSNL